MNTNSKMSNSYGIHGRGCHCEEPIQDTPTSTSTSAATSTSRRGPPPPTTLTVKQGKGYHNYIMGCILNLHEASWALGNMKPKLAHVNGSFNLRCSVIYGFRKERLLRGHNTKSCCCRRYKRIPRHRKEKQHSRTRRAIRAQCYAWIFRSKIVS